MDRAGQAATDVAEHVVMALMTYRRRLHRSGLAAPPAFDEFLSQVASGRLVASDSASTVDDREALCMKFSRVADLLAVSERTVDRLVASGALPVVEVGGAPRVRIADLDAYVQGLPVRGAA